MTMSVLPMDRDKLLELVAGEPDLITPAAAADHTFYYSQTCRRCGGNCAPEADVQKMVRTGRTAGDVHNCRCQTCGCLFNPYTNLIIELGNLGKLEPAVPLIHNDPED